MGKSNTSGQRFREMEYVFTKYYNENIASVVSQQQRLVRQKQEEETRSRKDSGWGGYVDASSPFTTTQLANETGPWNKKTADDLVRMIQEQIEGNKKIKEDLSVLAAAWRTSAIKELGLEKYKELSSKCPSKDLAVDFVNNRFENLILEQLVKSKVPKSSLEYILKKGVSESLFGVLVPSIRSNTDLENKLADISEKLYNPSGVEKASAAVTSFLADAAAMGGVGYGKVVHTGALLAVDVGGRFAVSALGEDGFDENLGKEVYSNKNAFNNYRKSAKNVKPQNSEFIDIVNKNLNNKIKVPAYRPPYDHQEDKLMRRQLLQAAAGDASVNFSNIKKSFDNEGIKVKAFSSIPTWMMEKSEGELLQQSANFSAMAIEMKRSQKNYMKIGNKTYSFDEIAQRGYDYARAAKLKTTEKAMENADENSESKGNTQQKSFYSSQQSYQAQQQQQQQYMQAQYNQNQYQQNMSQNSQQGQNYQQSGMAGWSSLMNQFGLTGMSDIGKNLGYVLAMLPDMLIAMLTGKSQSLHLKDNLLPFGAILAGFFVKNPILKMLLIGLGGANILNKAGHEILDNAGVKTQQQPKRYVQHANEMLSERISDPVMKGNALVASIDHKPCVIYIDEQCADAYYQGKIPLNTLCNAVLRKYDEQREAVSQQYERNIGQQEEQQQSRGIK